MFHNWAVRIQRLENKERIVFFPSTFIILVSLLETQILFVNVMPIFIALFLFGLMDTKLTNRLLAFTIVEIGISPYFTSQTRNEVKRYLEWQWNERRIYFFWHVFRLTSLGHFSEIPLGLGAAYPIFRCNVCEKFPRRGWTIRRRESGNSLREAVRRGRTANWVYWLSF